MAEIRFPLSVPLLLAALVLPVSVSVGMPPALAADAAATAAPPPQLAQAAATTGSVRRLTGKRVSAFGMTLSDLSPALRRVYGLQESESGVVIAYVARGSAAHAAGLRPGGLLRAVSGLPVKDTDAALAWIERRQKAGQSLVFRVEQNGASLTFTLKASPSTRTSSQTSTRTQAPTRTRSADATPPPSRGATPPAAPAPARSARPAGTASASVSGDSLYSFALNALTVGDHVAAFQNFTALAERNDVRGQNGLGFLYKNGLGVEKDYRAAVSWYRKAAERGHAKAQNNLAYMYLHGLGLPRDKIEARHWYKRAAGQGFAPARRALKEMDGQAPEPSIAPPTFAGQQVFDYETSAILPTRPVGPPPTASYRLPSASQGSGQAGAGAGSRGTSAAAGEDWRRFLPGGTLGRRKGGADSEFAPPKGERDQGLAALPSPPPATTKGRATVSAGASLATMERYEILGVHVGMFLEGLTPALEASRPSFMRELKGTHTTENGQALDYVSDIFVFWDVPAPKETDRDAIETFWRKELPAKMHIQLTPGLPVDGERRYTSRVFRVAYVDARNSGRRPSHTYIEGIKNSVIRRFGEPMDLFHARCRNTAYRDDRRPIRKYELSWVKTYISAVPRRLDQVVAEVGAREVDCANRLEILVEHQSLFDKDVQRLERLYRLQADRSTQEKKEAPAKTAHKAADIRTR